MKAIKTLLRAAAAVGVVLLLATAAFGAGAEKTQFHARGRVTAIDPNGIISCPGGEPTGYPYPHFNPGDPICTGPWGMCPPCTEGSRFHIRARGHHGWMDADPERPDEMDPRIRVQWVNEVNWNFDDNFPNEGGPMWGAFRMVVVDEKGAPTGGVWEGTWTGKWNGTGAPKAEIQMRGHGTGGAINGAKLKLDLVQPGHGFFSVDGEILAPGNRN